MNFLEVHAQIYIAVDKIAAFKVEGLETECELMAYTVGDELPPVTVQYFTSNYGGAGSAFTKAEEFLARLVQRIVNADDGDIITVESTK